MATIGKWMRSGSSNSQKCIGKSERIHSDPACVRVRQRPTKTISPSSLQGNERKHPPLTFKEQHHFTILPEHVTHLSLRCCQPVLLLQQTLCAHKFCYLYLKILIFRAICTLLLTRCFPSSVQLQSIQIQMLKFVCSEMDTLCARRMCVSLKSKQNETVVEDH